MAEHPAVEAPESSPPLPLSSLQPEASPGRSNQNYQVVLLSGNSAFLSCVSLCITGFTHAHTARQPVLCAQLSARDWSCTVIPKPRAACRAVFLSRLSAQWAKSRQHSGLGLLVTFAVEVTHMGCTRVCWKDSALTLSYQSHLATLNSLPLPSMWLTYRGALHVLVLGRDGKVPCIAKTLIWNCHQGKWQGYWSSLVWTDASKLALGAVA